MSDLREQRAEISPLIPNELLALYDKIGTSHGGVGAAELRARRCGLPARGQRGRAAGIPAAAADDEVLRCEECGRS